MSQEVITKFTDSVVGSSNILLHIACMPTPLFAQLPYMHKALKCHLAINSFLKRIK
ncbi:hypothetical protein ACRN94_21855 [Shewanella baltica]|uniref:hypothetical protein n=1 Tax=Shewanella baltica TaxID=62322 RepID=UPI003D7BBBFE